MNCVVLGCGEKAEGEDLVITALDRFTNPAEVHVPLCAAHYLALTMPWHADHFPEVWNVTGLRQAADEPPAE